MPNLLQTSLPCSLQPHYRSWCAPKAMIPRHDWTSIAIRHRKAQDLTQSAAVPHHDRAAKSFQPPPRLDTISRRKPPSAPRLSSTRFIAHG